MATTEPMNDCSTCRFGDTESADGLCRSCIDDLELFPKWEPIDDHPDLVTRPSHYTQYKIEPITFIMRNGLEFWRGNIVKYAARAGSKMYDGQDKTESEITDLRKVIRYAEMRINMLNGETEL